MQSFGLAGAQQHLIHYAPQGKHSAQVMVPARPISSPLLVFQSEDACHGMDGAVQASAQKLQFRASSSNSGPVNVTSCYADIVADALSPAGKRAHKKGIADDGLRASTAMAFAGHPCLQYQQFKLRSCSLPLSDM